MKKQSPNENIRITEKIPVCELARDIIDGWLDGSNLGPAPRKVNET